MYTDSTSVEPYEIIAYNEPNDVVISGNDAVISMGEDGLLAALPDYLFAGDTTVSVEAGDTALVSLRMRRLLSPITLTLNFTDTAKVADVEATLTGLISSIHLPDGTPTGDNSLRSTGGSTARMAYEALPEDKGIRLLLHLSRQAHKCPQHPSGEKGMPHRQPPHQGNANQCPPSHHPTDGQRPLLAGIATRTTQFDKHVIDNDCQIPHTNPLVGKVRQLVPQGGGKFFLVHYPERRHAQDQAFPRRNEQIPKANG